MKYPKFSFYGDIGYAFNFAWLKETQGFNIGFGMKFHLLKGFPIYEPISIYLGLGFHWFMYGNDYRNMFLYSTPYIGAGLSYVFKFNPYKKAGFFFDIFFGIASYHYLYVNLIDMFFYPETVNSQEGLIRLKLMLKIGYYF